MFFIFFDEKPNAMLGIAPNNPTMSFKAPARSPQVVWRISMASISNRVYPKKAATRSSARRFKEIIKRSSRTFCALHVLYVEQQQSR